MLFQALIGQSDLQIAELLSITPGAVKKRWAAIYDRVASVDEALLPARDKEGRGSEKRGILLHYLRSHLEELRPTIAPHTAGAVYRTGDGRKR